MGGLVSPMQAWLSGRAWTLDRWTDWTAALYFNVQSTRGRRVDG